MKPLFAILLAACLVISGCGDKELTLKMNDALSPEDKQLALNGVAAMMDVCPGLARHVVDLSSGGSVDVRGASLTDQRELGWERTVAVEIHVAERPRSIPSTYRAQGNRCYFDISVSPPHGVSIAKSPCIALCQDSPATVPWAFMPAKL